MFKDWSVILSKSIPLPKDKQLPTSCKYILKFVKFTHIAKNLQENLNKNILEIKQNNKIFVPIDKFKNISVKENYYYCNFVRVRRLM